MIRRDESPRPGRVSDITCIRCLVVTPSEDLDRLLWCENCVALARRRALRIGMMAGVGLALALAIYVWFWIQPDLSLIPTGWLLMLAVAFYFGGRVARELAYGVMRWQNRPAVEAHPPA